MTPVSGIHGMIRTIALWRVFKQVTAACIGLVAVWIFLAFTHLLPWKLEYRAEMSAGNVLIAKIENFRKEHGRLPDAEKPQEIVPLGFELRTGYHPDYKVAGDYYEITYVFGFDGPYIVYSSRTKQWRCDYYC